MSRQSTQQIVDIICNQIGFWEGRTMFNPFVWEAEPNAIGIVKRGGEIQDIMQSDDARTLYYAARAAVRFREFRHRNLAA